MFLILNDDEVINLEHVVAMDIVCEHEPHISYILTFSLSNGSKKSIRYSKQSEAERTLHEIMLNYSNHSGCGVYSLGDENSPNYMFR